MKIDVDGGVLLVCQGGSVEMPEIEVRDHRSLVIFSFLIRPPLGNFLPPKPLESIENSNIKRRHVVETSFH